MDVNFIDSNGLLVAVVDNFYSEESLAAIDEEVKFLNNPKVFSLFTNEFVATLEEGKAKQKSKSLFLDDFFGKNRNASSILRENRRLFSDELCTAIEQKNAFFGHVKKSERDHTLINFYFAGDYYLPHKDSNCLTALTFIDSVDLIGGDFCFPDYDVSIAPIRNRVVIFPGCVSHSSTPVERGVKISMAQFLTY